MYSISLILNCLPNLGFPFLSGVLPLRYFGLLFSIFSFKVPKVAAWFLVLAVAHFIYALATTEVGRPFSSADIAISAMYVLLFWQLMIVYKKPKMFSIFVILFLWANIIYSFFQVLFFYLGADHDLLMIHQNSHKDDYVMPEASHPPYLPRFTGLFVESAPFVIYLMFSYIFLAFAKIYRLSRLSIILVMFLSGAKSGLVFVIVAVLHEAKAFRLLSARITYLLLILFFVVLIFNGERVVEFFTRDLPLGSISLRLSWMLSSWRTFFADPAAMLFGLGAFSTTDALAGEAEMRGLDFFSFYIMSFGLIGASLLMFYPVYFLKSVVTRLYSSEKKLLVITLIVSLMTLGSISNYQYTYLYTCMYFIFIQRNHGESLRHNC